MHHYHVYCCICTLRLWLMANMTSHNVDEMIRSKWHHGHISNCSRFNSISPQFRISPPERGAHCFTACPLSWAGQTIRRSNAYLTSNLNSISLCWIHTTADPNHPKSALICMCVRESVRRWAHACVKELHEQREERERGKKEKGKAK